MTGSVDLVLSSGFLAFAAQAGFLAGIEDLGLSVDGVCGTSSGALAGSLWAAGMPAHEVFERLTQRAPLTFLRPSTRPWRGLFALHAMIEELRRDLPATFAGLERPFGVGLMATDGSAHLCTQGVLPDAIAASCAIPKIFHPVSIAGIPWADGGMVDRTAIDAWRAHRGGPDIVLHLLEKHDGRPEPVPHEPTVHSPRSRAAFWSLGDARTRFDRTRAATVARLGPTLRP